MWAACECTIKSHGLEKSSLHTAHNSFVDDGNGFSNLKKKSLKLIWKGKLTFTTPAWSCYEKIRKKKLRKNMPKNWS